MIPIQNIHFNHSQRPRQGEGVGNHKISRTSGSHKLLLVENIWKQKRNTFPTFKP